jgi:hypothetical protein
MVDYPAQTVTPFLDIQNRPEGRFARVGYRPLAFENAVACLELPFQLFEQAVGCGLDLTTRITPSGEVVSNVSGSSETSQTYLRSVSSIDILISQAVSADNFRLEEASLADLQEFLKKLESGIEHVKVAVRRMSVAV